MTEKQIPESKIALNPVVINDSKRGLPPQNNIPPDMDALMAWLKEQALYEHNKEHEITSQANYDQRKRWWHSARESFANETIAKIENSRINQRPHVPRGWDYVL